jgi:hypothetical protein
MTGPAGTSPRPSGGPGSDLPLRDGRYARVERERRFLLAEPPSASGTTAARQITDRYVTGTRLRLRRVDHLASRVCEFKLAQKVPAGRPGPARGLITNIYLSEDEYDRPVPRILRKQAD